MKLALYCVVFTVTAALYGCSDDSLMKATATRQIDDVLPHVTVYKSATCGCCKEWVTYLEEEGFSVTAIDHEDMESVKFKLGIRKDELKSCHTATIGDYLIEGHVPSGDILRLLAEQPDDIMGLTAPGMPLMSPGMASRTPKDYAILSFTESGESRIYSQY